jgi:hypothetical protein
MKPLEQLKKTIASCYLLGAGFGPLAMGTGAAGRGLGVSAAAGPLSTAYRGRCCWKKFWAVDWSTGVAEAGCCDAPAAEALGAVGGTAAGELEEEGAVMPTTELEPAMTC